MRLEPIPSSGTTSSSLAIASSRSPSVVTSRSEEAGRLIRREMIRKQFPDAPIVAR
jgi:hypothetical protein